jgi:hypothetical protein
MAEDLRLIREVVIEEHLARYHRPSFWQFLKAWLRRR